MSVHETASEVLSRVPPPKRAARESAATTRPEDEGRGAPPFPLTDDLVRSAKLLSRTPAARPGLMARLSRQVPALRAVSEDQARVLGEIVGAARADGYEVLAALFRTPVALPWSRALLNGLFESWPEALRSVRLRELWSEQSTFSPALEDSLRDGSWDRRWAVASLYGRRAARGSASALRSIERMTLDPRLTREQQEEMAQLFTDRGLEAIMALAGGPDVQPAVDVAVAIVDVCLKVGQTAILDRALATTNPDETPAEIVLAFLTTTITASSRLPARAHLVERFEKAIRGRLRPDADALMRFLR